MTPARVIVVAAAVCLGLAAQLAGPFWGRPLLWVPDLVVGVVLIGAGVVAWDRSRGTGWLLGAAGLAWFAGSMMPAAHFWHRGLLIHLLLTYPGARPRSRVVWVAVVAGYATAVVPGVWRDPFAAVGLSAALIVVALRRRTEIAPGSGRLSRQVSLVALGAVALGVAIAGGEVARGRVPGHRAVVPALIFYELVLVGVAMLMVVGLRAPAVARVADLVVELGESGTDPLRDELARALGDPTLQLGRWASESGRYLDDRGRVISPPDPADPVRAATYVERDDRPLALLVHDAAVLQDPALVDAVQAAARLAAEHAKLQARVTDRVDAVDASRRRLLLAADDERQRLEGRLREGVGRRLRILAELLGPIGGDRLTVARERLERTRAGLDEVAQGLRPHVLDEGGLAAALTDLAGGSAVPVDLSVTFDRLRPEVEAAAYYVCAEALTNVAKHAGASRVTIEAEYTGSELRVIIADDGVGGADAACGSGLQGLADRVEALGGVLLLESPVGGGTRLVATIPLDWRNSRPGAAHPVLQ